MAAYPELRSCYLPDGSNATDYQYYPCSGDTHSSCCLPSQQDQCLSNGLCNVPGAYTYRAACTDQTWKDPNCPQFCKEYSKNSYEVLTNCGGTEYCCMSSDDDDCCAKQELKFNIGSPEIIFDFATIDPFSRSTAPPASFRTASQQGIFPSQSASTASSSIRPGTTGADGTPASTSSATSGSSNIAIAAGVGVGVGVLVIALAFLGFCLFRRKKKQTAARGISLPDDPMKPELAGQPVVPPAKYEYSPAANPGVAQLEASAPPYQPSFPQGYYEMQTPTPQLNTPELKTHPTRPDARFHGGPMYEAP
ncbi:hypothetical protein P152DRAFT_222598 [Eremomyces bilateralis CBS 781.70]|uniref:Mid2 domain-containing protein n=1 Tax=Eremomyces bilateralis CBS 781.70 TaxID=1392243 RepID=A0A6G1FRU1_9PEZI|nr:uncharacterized protein P152DRAFT_222598 [Eremomyces bilateralis CBS 781.70]KAF1808446.1 hypothetical protein P152DRAFT_222598 [Eremomyces bilateralis CBS 781.70]